MATEPTPARPAKPPMRHPNGGQLVDVFLFDNLDKHAARDFPAHLRPPSAIVLGRDVREVVFATRGRMVRHVIDFSSGSTETRRIIDALTSRQVSTGQYFLKSQPWPELLACETPEQVAALLDGYDGKA